MDIPFNVFDMVLNKMPLGFELYDPNGLLMMMNEQQMKYLAISDPSKYINKFNVINDPYCALNGQSDSFKKAFDTGETIHYEITIDFNNTNSPYPNRNLVSFFEITLFSIKDNIGKIQGLIALTNDISLRKNNEQKLIEQNKRFENYSFTLSHVIRKPIANLISLTTLLHDYVGLDIDDQHTIDNIHQSVLDLDTIIKKLYSNINSKF